MNRPIFIFGCRRSGTTLMLNCLNHHPDIGLFPGETHYFQRHLGGYKNRGKRTPLKQSDITFRTQLLNVNKSLLLKKSYQQYFITNLWKARVNGYKQIDSTLSYLYAINSIDKNNPEKTFFEHFLKEISRQQKAKIWGEKSPMHIFYLDKLREWFQNAHFIQLVRDPRSTACSHVYRVVKNSSLNVNPKFGFLHITFPRLLHRWKETSQIGMENRNKKDYTIIKFESLLAEPEKVLKELSEALQIPYNKKMMDINVYHSSYKNNKKGFDKSKTETWKEKAPFFANKITSVYCKKEMEYYGYE